MSTWHAFQYIAVVSSKRAVANGIRILIVTRFRPNLRKAWVDRVVAPLIFLLFYFLQQLYKLKPSVLMLPPSIMQAKYMYMYVCIKF